MQSWHTATLESEFTAADASTETTLADYLAREDRLFAELREEVYQTIVTTGATAYSRYRADGPQDPAQVNQNWNRSFELIPKNPRGGALLLHGLTDSPYSVRRIGQILFDQGYYVLGLRLPGHGTAPAALTRVYWEDWVAASRLGAQHVKATIGQDKPFIVGGYSNGGGLSVKYALDALTDQALPTPDQLLLFSPEIGITPAAVIANVHKLLSFIPYFEQFKWLSVQPEFDPFKYNSFPKNAAREAWQVTRAINQEIQARYEDGNLVNFPPVLTFLSWSDSTVSTEATIRRLYDRLSNDGNELVVFDINRIDELAAFIPATQEQALDDWAARDDLPFRLTVIGNINLNSDALARRTKAPRSTDVDVRPLNMEWPPDIYSLAHVAIPFAPDDPVYGIEVAANGSYQGLPLGALQPRGETRMLSAPIGQLMRLRHNPFFDYIEQRLVKKTEKLEKRKSTISP
ncbi:MAG: alpha/beta hydrolase [Gammaproteobacteria bacterium]